MRVQGFIPHKSDVKLKCELVTHTRTHTLALRFVFIICQVSMNSQNIPLWHALLLLCVLTSICLGHYTDGGDSSHLITHDCTNHDSAITLHIKCELAYECTKTHPQTHFRIQQINV